MTRSWFRVIVALACSGYSIAPGFAQEAETVTQNPISGASPTYQSAEIVGLPTTVSELLAMGPARYSPGIRLGSFIVNSSASTSISYNDNVFARPSNPKSDEITKVDAELSAISTWSRHALGFYAGGGYRFNNNFQTEDEGHANAGAMGLLEFQRDLWLQAYANYRYGTEPRGTGESFLPFEDPIQTQKADGSAVLHKSFNRLWLEFGGAAQHEDFTNGKIVSGTGVTIVDEGFRNGETYNGIGRVGYEFSPKTSIFFEGDYDRRLYQDTRFDSDGYRVLGGLRYEFTRLIHGDLAAGYLHQDTQAGLKPIDNFTYRAQLQWQASPLWQLALVGSREVGSPSQFTGSDSNRVTSDIAARVDYAFRRNITLMAGAGYGRVDYIDIARADDYVKVGVGADYLLRNWLSLWTRYDFTHYTSNISPNIDYDQNMITAGLRARY
jgi:hypothetical protein